MSADPADQPPHYLVQRVREALAHDERVSEMEIKVKIYGKRVFLTGLVPTKERKEAIDAVVAEVLPGFEVHNDTTVETFPEAVQVEELS